MNEDKTPPAPPAPPPEPPEPPKPNRVSRRAARAPCTRGRDRNRDTKIAARFAPLTAGRTSSAAPNGMSPGDLVTHYGNVLNQGCLEGVLVNACPSGASWSDHRQKLCNC